MVQQIKDFVNPSDIIKLRTIVWSIDWFDRGRVIVILPCIYQMVYVLFVGISEDRPCKFLICRSVCGIVDDIKADFMSYPLVLQ
jgi:hypothetical protein